MVGVVAAAQVGTALDLVKVVVGDTLRAGEAVGQALGSNASAGQLALAVTVDAGRVATLALPGAVAVRIVSGTSAATATAGGAIDGTKVYRVWGGKSGPWGESWTSVNPKTVPNFRSAAGLPDVNAGRFVSEGILQSTEGVTARGALIIKPGQRGGLPELVINNPEQRIKLQRVSGVNPEF